jgi:hypothetical protein
MNHGNSPSSVMYAELKQMGMSNRDVAAILLDSKRTFGESPLQNRIGLETDLQASRWVLGEDELTDESVAAFRGRLHELGVEDFMGFWQELLDKLEDD